MPTKLATKLLASLLLVVAGFVASVSTASSENTDQVLKNIESLIAARFQGLEITKISPSPVKGIYEWVSGGQIFYISEDANHLFNGALIDTITRSDLTAARVGKIHIGLINDIGDHNMLIYEPQKPINKTVTVFTDTSCPYCSQLHSEIDELLGEGIRVRYLMFPRAGLGSETHKELESVWCANDPLAAMTSAKAGGWVDHATCKNPIESHVAVANAIGLRGTPLIYLDDGQSIAGYRPAKDLIALIKE
ncbi:MAG: DsbC family protein [Granulosicoccaceae bacterium]